MWDPRPWVQARPSFPRAIAAPVAAPCDPPLVCIQINAEYVPFVAGALSQLTQRTTWLAPDEDTLQGILANMTWLVEIIGTAVQCSQPPAIPGQTGSQSACNIAGYLSNYVIRHAITQAIQSLQFNLTVLGFLDRLGPLLIPIFPIASAGIGAFIFLYQKITPMTISAFQSAVDDPTLFGSIACAIYAAIQTDGQVTPANFPTIVSNVDAITFASSDVHDAVVSLISDMGAGGLSNIQIPGVVASYDCSGCGTGPALGPIGPEPRRITGTDFLEIGAGFVDAVLPILFPVPFPSPPLLTVGADNQDLIASFVDTTATGTTLRLTAAVPVAATMSANIDWQATQPGVEP